MVCLDSDKVIVLTNYRRNIYRTPSLSYHSAFAFPVPKIMLRDHVNRRSTLCSASSTSINHWTGHTPNQHLSTPKQGTLTYTGKKIWHLPPNPPDICFPLIGSSTSHAFKRLRLRLLFISYHFNIDDYAGDIIHLKRWSIFVTSYSDSPEKKLASSGAFCCTYGSYIESYQPHHAAELSPRSDRLR